MPTGYRVTKTIGLLISLGCLSSATPAATPVHPYVAHLAQKAELDSKIVRRIQTIAGKLDAFDKHLVAKNEKEARSDLKAAEAELGKINNWYKGKFDASHPDYVAICKRLETAKTKIGGSKKATPAKKKAPAKSTTSGQKPKQLFYKVARIVETLHSKLDDVDKLVGAQDLKEAKRSLQSAQKELKKIHDWHKGKFDATHPDFLAITKRMNEAIDKVDGKGGLGAQAASLALELGAVIGVLDKASSDLYAGLDSVRRQSSAFENSYYSGDGVEKAIAGARAAVERGNVIHSAALATTAQFHKQFPSLETLSNLVKNGDSAIHTLERIEEFGGSWDRIRQQALERPMESALSRARDCFKAFELAGKNSDFLPGAISDGDGVCTLLDRVNRFASAVLGSETTESAELKAFARKNAEVEEQLGALTLAVAEGRGEEANAAKLKLSRARYPQPTHSGGEWTAVEKNMKKLFEADTKDKLGVRVGVYSPWDERTEARWINEHWVVGTYRYVGGTILAKLPDGRYRVYRVSFRRTQQSDGDFGPLTVFGFGHSFEISEENINL